MFKILEDKKESGPFAVLLKVTHGCNLDCQYCYDKPFREKYGNKVVSYETIDQILKIVSKHTNHIQWVWHGGEPTTLGVDWYIKAQEIFYRYPNLTVEQRLQSNGVLLDENWAKLSLQYGISIGVSYDAFGQEIRLNGKSFKVEDSLDKFRKAGGQFGLISVINKTNYKKMIQLYEYCKERGIQNSMNPIYKTAGTTEYDLGLTAEEYATEFNDFFKYWMHDNSELAVMERMNEIMLSKVTGDESIRICNYSDCRQGWLGINPNGDLYPCDRHTSEEYSYGNIFDFNSISEIYEASKGYKKYTTDIELRLNTHCQDCGYIKYCQGGCNATHVSSKGSATEVDDFSCELFRQEFNGVYETLRDVDIYDNSKHFHISFSKRIIESPVFLLKEIKDYLRGKGMPEHLLNLNYISNGKELLNCQEFKLFTVFNQYKGEDVFTGKYGYFNAVNNYDTTVTTNFDFNTIKNQRLESLDSIWNSQKNKILEVLFQK